MRSVSLAGADIVMEMYQKGELEQAVKSWTRREPVLRCWSWPMRVSPVALSLPQPRPVWSTPQARPLLDDKACASGNVKLIDDPNRLRLFKWDRSGRPTATELCRALDRSFALVDLMLGEHLKCIFG